MSWTNIRLIWFREVRDQLRDRRTIFTIAVLPLLLYPLLGMTFLQIAQFMKEHETRVWVIGAECLPDSPSLLDGERFAAEFCPDDEARLLQVSFPDPLSADEDVVDVARREINEGNCDVVLYFPADFPGQLSEQIQESDRGEPGVRSSAFRRSAGPGREADGEIEPGVSEKDNQIDAPESMILANEADDKSRIAADRVDRVLARWRDAIVRNNLEASRVPLSAVEPFRITHSDVSEDIGRRAVVWSKVLPFIMLVWALTGAFYPAIDLCAGEKERGTLETLLSSPARRTEIVGGKLLTVMTFSVATALLNLLSMGITGIIIIGQIQELPGAAVGLDLGPPPLMAVLWLLLAILPVAAMFSAVALAVAAFARSAKEGQYYLMPLLLISLPLMTLPMLPAAELEMGTAIIPIAGMTLWLRTLIEGQYSEAIHFALPVLGVTALCCWLAVRWAVQQFETESVLFRESERFGLGLWLRHKVRDRGDTPSAGEALLCGVLVLLVTFFGGLHASQPSSWGDLVRIVVVTQFVLVLAPAVIMTVILTRSPLKTLLFTWPKPLTVIAAFLLAVALHPLVVLLGQWIEVTYPLSEETARAVGQLTSLMRDAPTWQLILVIAAVPALCEEIVFRGFILSGLRHLGSKWAAIVISSLFFGVTHGMLQQSLAAAVVGLVLGYLAVQCGSLLPAMVFHLTHNSLGVLLSRVTPETAQNLHWLVRTSESSVAPHAYRWPVLLAGTVFSLALLFYFQGLPHVRSPEEQLHEALSRQ
jgi:sodium transport system permease protein